MGLMTAAHGKKLPEGTADRSNAAELPDHLYQMVRGYMPSRCALTALELDIFTAIGEGATSARVASRVNANPRATEILLNALVALGLLTKQGRQYRNTAESERFFTQRSTDNHRDGLLHVANIWHHWSTLTEVVRGGRRVPGAGDDTAQGTWDFIAAMQQNAGNRAPAVVKALSTEGIRRILDLGGGSGIYSIAFAKASPAIQCDILDLPEVVPLTSEYVRKARVSAQVTVRAGDMLHDELGSGYDLVMLNAICHMFSADQNKSLFLRARRALDPNGRLAVQDFILNPDKASPLHAALFSVNMLVGTDAGACYSEAEYTDWMKRAGFAKVQRIVLPGPSNLIVGQLK